MNRGIEKIKVKNVFIAQSDSFGSAVGEKHQPRREKMQHYLLQNAPWRQEIIQAASIGHQNYWHSTLLEEM